MSGENEAAPSEVEENELRVFVASTLEAIMAGITDAQPSARVKSAHGTGTYAFSAPKEVTFDVAVTVKRTGSKSGGFKVQVFSMGANAGADAASENSTVTRVQFTVPSKFKLDKAQGKTKRRSDTKTEAEEAPHEFEDE
ncbi:MAG TPA: trypco2 family protein [Allosphingosinicella sp.]